MQVALQAPSLVFLGLHQAGSRRRQLLRLRLELRQPRVQLRAESEGVERMPHLGGQSIGQPLVARFVDPDLAHDFGAVGHRGRFPERPYLTGRPNSGLSPAARQHEVHSCSPASDPSPHRFGDLRQRALPIARSRRLREPREQCVRIGRHSIHEPVGEPLESCPHRLNQHHDEGHRDD